MKTILAAFILLVLTAPLFAQNGSGTGSYGTIGPSEGSGSGNVSSNTAVTFTSVGTGTLNVSNNATIGTAIVTNVAFLGAVAITNLSIEPMPSGAAIGWVFTLTNTLTGAGTWQAASVGGGGNMYSNTASSLNSLGVGILNVTNNETVSGILTNTGGTSFANGATNYSTTAAINSAGGFVGSGAGLTSVPATAVNWPATNFMQGSGLINAALPVETCYTNASFTFGLPINVVVGEYNSPVILVTNYLGSLITITPQAQWHTIGTWNCTNWSRIMLDIIPNVITNAACVPIW